jgi:hypothetical protein
MGADILLKDISTRVSAAADLSPDDMMITLYEAPGENFSFGQGEAQRVNAVRAGTERKRIKGLKSRAAPRNLARSFSQRTAI